MLLIKNDLKAIGKEKYGHVSVQCRSVYQGYQAFDWIWLLNFGS